MNSDQTPDTRLRVLLITNLYPTPGDPSRGIFVHQMVRRLQDFCDVTVVCPLPWFPSVAFLSFLKRWYPFALVPASYEVGRVSVRSPKYFMLPGVSESIHSVLMFMGIVARAWLLHRRDRFDVINAHWLYPDGVAAAWLSRLLRLPLVLSGRGSDVNLELSQPGKRWQIVGALAHASAVTVVSNMLKERLVAEAVPGDRISPIPNGVDTEVFFPRTRSSCAAALGLPPSAKRILFVGRLLEIKGIDYLLQATVDLKQNGVEFQACLVGEDVDDRGIYQSLARSLGVSDKVSFVGGRSHQEIAQWMGASDVLCLPSLWEGCPNVVLEALACGRPVVASRVGGIPDLINDRNGILVEPGNSRALGQALRKALETSWDEEKIHASVEPYSWDRAARSYHRVLAEAVRSSH